MEDGDSAGKGGERWFCIVVLDSSLLLTGRTRVTLNAGADPPKHRPSPTSGFEGAESGYRDASLHFTQGFFFPVTSTKKHSDDGIMYHVSWISLIHDTWQNPPNPNVRVIRAVVVRIRWSLIRDT
jgi:hypothetical protein